MNKTRTQLKEVRKILEEALAEAGKKAGYNFTVEAFRFQENGNFHTKLVAEKEGEAGYEQQIYEANIQSLGLPPYETEINISGDTYNAIGLNRTGSKVIIRRKKDGARFQYATRTFLKHVDMMRKAGVL